MAFQTPVTRTIVVTQLLFLLFHCSVSVAQMSYPYLTTSNGLIVATFNSERGVVEGVWPHIFAAIDSGKFVHPFVGNIRPVTGEKLVSAVYRQHTHVIECIYPSFTVHYVTPFSTEEKVFYAVFRGKSSILRGTGIEVESGNGKPVTGVTHLANPFESLPDMYSGELLLDSVFLEKNEGNAEKVYVFTFNDSLHSNRKLLKLAVNRLKKQDIYIVDQETGFMRNIIEKCGIPGDVTAEERALLEQSVSILMMSQVSEKEIFPGGRGQVLASLRPGIWHVGWVRDGSFVIQGMNRIGMFAQAKKALEFMLQAEAGLFKHYRHTDGRDYGPGVDYRISLTRYFGNGKEECDYNEHGPNIEFDDWGLFLTAYSDYILRSGDLDFARKWAPTVRKEVADAIIAVTAPNGLIRADSGPWEHHLRDVKQYAFTSAVCANGLRLFAEVENRTGGEYHKYQRGSKKITGGMDSVLLVNQRFYRSNSTDTDPATAEYHDAGSLEIFACGLLPDAEKLFETNMDEYDPVLRIEGEIPGYIRMRSDDIYENQEWVFINLRMACAFNRYGKPEVARQIINRMTRLAAQNNHQLPEMLTYINLWKKPVATYNDSEAWCYCIRDKNGQYAGAIPMAGYGAGAYIIALFEYYEGVDE